MTKYSIAIISASVREGRNSHRVALYFRNYLSEQGIAVVNMLDLDEYRFPLFNERLRFQKDPSPAVLDFASKISKADGVIIVTPEYNGGYPASLKNVIDLLYAEWYHKPVAISTVSDGTFGGSQVITSLQFILWKIKALTVPAQFPVPQVSQLFDESGNPADKQAVEKRLKPFLDEFFWCIGAVNRMRDQ